MRPLSSENRDSKRNKFVFDYLSHFFHSVFIALSEIALRNALNKYDKIYV